MGEKVGIVLLSVFLVSIAVIVSQVQNRQTTRQYGATIFPATYISITQDKFAINGQLTYPGKSVEGLLLNSRMIQGIFDDENPATVDKWAYPDTKKWNPQRNTSELVNAMPSYAKQGLRMITVGMQGGCPVCDSTNGTNITTAFNPDGSLKPAWLSRLDQVIRAADANGIVVTVSFFYAKQNKRLSNEQAVINGINNITDWLVAGGYTNVFIEIANECNIGGFYPYLSSNVVTAIKQAQTRSNGKLKVSVSYTGGVIPPPAVISQEDYITIHGNGQSPSQITSMIATIKAMSMYKSNPKPIVFNEDSTNTSIMDAAVQSYASWGYYDQGKNNYFDGFQSPPTNWIINTSSKKAFFAEVFSLTGGNPSTATLTMATTLSPTPGLTDTPFSLILCPHGLGNCGDNINPQYQGNTNPNHTIRNATLTLSDTNGKPIASGNGNVIYSPTTMDFRGTIVISNIVSGNYLAAVKIDGLLSRQYPRIIQVTQGHPVMLSTLSLTTGDINNDNKLDILDYNDLVSCFGSKQSTPYCIYPPVFQSLGADINDDGVVDGSDYNLFLREFIGQKDN